MNSVIHLEHATFYLDDENYVTKIELNCNGIKKNIRLEHLAKGANSDVYRAYDLDENGQDKSDVPYVIKLFKIYSEKLTDAELLKNAHIKALDKTVQKRLTSEDFKDTQALKLSKNLVRHFSSDSFFTKIEVAHEYAALKAWLKDFTPEYYYIKQPEVKPSNLKLSDARDFEQVRFLTMPFVPGETVKDTMVKELIPEIVRLIKGSDRDKELAISMKVKEALSILLKCLQAMNEFHEKTGMVHGDSLLQNFKIEDGVVRIIDFDGCFKQGISQEHYREMFPRIWGGNECAAQELPVSLENTAMSNSSTVEITPLTAAVDLNALFASFNLEFIYSSLTDHDLLKIKENKNSYIDDINLAVGPLEKLQSFMAWSIANCCNSPRFTEVISSEPLIAEAIKMRDKKIKQKGLLYLFKRNDLNKIMNIIDSALNYICYNKESKINNLHKIRYDLLLNFQSEFANKKYLSREEVANKIKNFLSKLEVKPADDKALIKTWYVPKYIDKSMMGGINLPETSDFKGINKELALAFPDKPCALARCSVKEAIGHVEKFIEHFNDSENIKPSKHSHN